MLGFIVGTACLVGLCALKRGGCAGRWHHHRHRWGGGFPRRPRGWREGGRRVALTWLSDQLEATPGQERAIAAALDSLGTAQRKAHDDLRQAGRGLARELRGEHLDRDALQRHVSQAHGELVHLEEALLDAATAFHEALEPDQRRRLAELLERGLEHLDGDRWGCGCGGRDGDRERAA